MPARMKANGNFSETSVERFYSVRMKAGLSYDELEWCCWPGSPCNSLFEFQVVHRYVFI